MMRLFALSGTLLLVLVTALLWGIRTTPPDAAMRLLGGQAQQAGWQLRHSGLRWRWRGYSPQLQLQQLQLAGHGLQVELEGLDGRLDLWRSLWHGALVWRRLHLQSLDLQIAAEESDAARSGPSSAVRRQLRGLVEHSRMVSAGRLRLVWQLQDSAPLRYEISDLRLDNRQPLRQWRARMALGDGGQGLFAAQLRGGGARMRGRAHLRLSGTLPALPGLQAASSWAGELWVTRTSGPWQLFGLLSGRAGDDSLDAQLLGGWESGGGQLSLLNLNGTLGGGPLPLAALRLDSRMNGWQLSGAPLDLAAATRPLFGRVPILAGLRPGGRLSRWRLQMTDGDPWQLRGWLADGACDATRGGVPQIRGLSGALVAGPGGGRLELDSRSLSIWYKSIYDAPLHHSGMSGLLRWHLADGQLELSGQDLRADGPGAQITGGFRLHSPLRAGDDGLLRLDLHLGLRQMDAARWREMTPRAPVPVALWDWLSGSVEAGRVPQAAIIWRGSLRRGKGPHASTLQMVMDVRDARLRWHPEWPPLEGLGTVMWLSDNHGTAQVDASTWGTRWRDIGVRLSPDPDAGIMRLGLQGMGTGPVADLLDALRRTPLRARIGSGLDGWSAEGAAQTRLQLNLPLRAQIKADDIAVSVHSSLQEASLQNGILDARDITGDLYYNSRMEGTQGLRSEGLSGMFWGGPVRARLWQPSAEHLRLELQGSLAIQEAAARLPLAVLGGTGASKYTAQMDWNRQAQGRGWTYAMDARSDLRGMALRPPAVLAALGRDGGERGELVLRASQQPGAPQMQMHLQYGELLRADMRLGDGGLQSMGLGFRDAPPQLEDGIFGVRAALDGMNLARDLTPLIAAFGGDSSGREGLRPRIDVHIMQLHYLGRDWPDMQARVELRDARWSIDARSPLVSGSFEIARGNQMDLHFSHLRLPQPVASADPGDLSPSEVPFATVRIDSLHLQERDMGDWRFSMRPRDDGSLLVSDISSSQMEGRDGPGSSLGNIHWQRHGDAHTSRIQFHVSGRNIAAVLSRMMGMDELIKSRRFQFVGDLSWPGPPSAIRTRDLSGQIDFQMLTGSIDSRLINSNNLFFKLVGLINIYRWTQRLRLQVADLLSGDASYSKIEGSLSIEQGMARTYRPISAHLATGQLVVDGNYDSHSQNLDARLAMVLPMEKNMAWFVGILVSVPAAVGTWLAERLLFTRLDKPIDRLVSIHYTVQGHIDDLQVQQQRSGTVRNPDIQENPQ